MRQQPKPARQPEDLSLNISACFAALKPLARAGAHLAPLTPTSWGLRRCDAGSGPEPGALPLGLVRALERAGLIDVGDDDVGRLSDEGRAWLRRQLAAAKPEVRHQQVRQVETIQGRNGQADQVLVNLSESPLAWLRKRRDAKGKAMISQSEFEAGERLRRDFTKAGLMPTVTASWSGTSGPVRGRRKDGLRTNHELDLSDEAYAARARVAAALGAVGPEFETLLVDTCCFLRGFSTSEASYGWPRRSAKLVLKLALSALARHYASSAPTVLPIEGPVSAAGAA